MEINNPLITFFQKKILTWHHESNPRKHPWSDSKDAYKIWLSEIILQQTRIEQGLPYYIKFIEKYPTILELAKAKDEEVFLLWQGLGYYNRCRNLLETARYIAHEKSGIFPNNYNEILGLKGVGTYTAAAISSFAFGLPHAVLDGNVFRLLSRFFAIETPIDGNYGKKLFQEIARQLLPERQSADYNQAVMDFGATICTPNHPKCTVCPLAPKCKALAEQLITVLPIKEKKLKIKKRCFHYFLLQTDHEVFIHKRDEKDIWQNLFELFLIESNESFENNPEWQYLKTYATNAKNEVFKYHQTLTHQRIESHFYLIVLKKKPQELEKGIWVKLNELRNYAFPKTILAFFKAYFNDF